MADSSGFVANCERWLPVVGYEDSYQVSDQGRVRSLDRMVRSRYGGLQLRKGRLVGDALSTSQNGLQYKVVSLYHSERPRAQRRVHVLELEAHVGPRPDGHFGCHNNGNSLDNRLENLRWGTPASNVQDAIRHRSHWQVKKHECPRGHPLESPNLVAHAMAKGWRECLACGRAKNRARRTRQSGGSVHFERWADEYYAQIMQAEVA